MKKLISTVLSICACAISFCSCDMLFSEASNLVSIGSTVVENEETDTEDPDSEDSDSKDPDSGTPSDPEKDDDKIQYQYMAFTMSEKAVFTQYLGFVIPFLPNNEYYVKGIYAETDYEDGIWYRVVGATEEDFTLYRGMYSSYTGNGTYVDQVDDVTMYCYEKDDVEIEMTFYTNKGETYLDVYAYPPTQSGGVEDGDGGVDDGGDDDNQSSYKYTDFTSEEKEIYLEYVGFVIPFLPNDGYYVEGLYEETDYENGIWYCVVGLTEMGFELYKGMYSSYDYLGEYEDDYYGDTWYCYEKNGVEVEMAFYYDKGESYMEVKAYPPYDVGGGDIGGGDIGGGDIGGGSSDSDIEMLTNDGKGLPTSASGVYSVDFTKAQYVKDVSDQGYYLDGCPTQGKVNILVIPVEFSDATAASKGYSLDKLNLAFSGEVGALDYYSVREYYAKSSYGKLDLNFVVLDSWFKPKNKSSYYQNYTEYYEGTELAIGDQLIMDEALAYLESRMNLAQFDSDGNKVIDAVVMINTLDIGEDDFHWAYRYWNMYTDNNGEYYEYDGVSANDYLWASYQFMLETTDAGGNTIYRDNVTNTYTYIHEFAHILGADDYYDTSYTGEPLGGYDVMDAMLGDHNAYTKFNYGWLTSSRLVVASESVTLKLEDFSKNGDTIIIANNWDEKLGAYQEYFLVVYYTNNGLNAGEYGYFKESGVVVYHINASLYKEVYQGETYYDVYNNNTDESDPDGYGTENNLIEWVQTNQNTYVYGEGDSLSKSVKTDGGDKIAYTFTVDDLSATEATLTFYKNA